MSKFGYDYAYRNMTKSSMFSSQIGSQINDRKITSGSKFDREDFQLPDNSIHTCKYNLFTFLPKNLFYQYSKIANIYFLLLGVLQLIPQISNSEGQPTIWVPLFLINFTTAQETFQFNTLKRAKDLYEDLKRRKADEEENNSQTTVIQEIGEEKMSWKQLHVGNIIRVEKNEYFPADVLLLGSSENKGLCYIETKNLDGETNLKQKMYNENNQLIQQPIVIEFEKPNSVLNKFTGRVLMNNQKISIDANNFVLRGCSLRNTKWVNCVICYSGHDTKLFMNSYQSRAKSSSLEQSMNKQIIIIFIFMILFSVFAGLYYIISLDKNQDELDYLEHENDENNFVIFIIQFFSWMLLLSNLVPISLLVTLEVVKTIQGILIATDEGMRHQATQIPTQVQTSSLNEELGQIEYVFSDKTGTLTCNIMEFKKLSVNGISYGDVKKGQKNYIEDISSFEKVTNVDFRDIQLFQALNQQSHPEHYQIKNTLFLLALCHTIIIERQEGKLLYNASSPDELALINFAKYCGVTYLGINEENIMELQYKSNNYSYKLLHVLEFNSSRKRMSVILRDLNNQKLLLYTKGADSIIMKRLSTKGNHELNQIIEHLANYGVIGLRTLLLAERVLDETYFQDWNIRYNDACATLEKREEKMDMLQEELEVDLQIVGATAIEDKLQDQVGETIAALLRTGIKVWVLTGDKIETAINIAFSCKLLNSSMNQIIIDEKEEVDLVKALEDAVKKIEHEDEDNSSFAFIISGDALLHGLKSTVSKKIMSIGSRCDAVLCCRVTPQQKQEVVQLVRRERPEVATLAIGDGANDVSMINAAHVGVGIKGLEGAQASRASDYAIGEFKILRRLLFYHGRECYRRNAILILFNFYKNTLLVMPLFWYGIVSYYSGPTFYDNYIYQLFNVCFAAQPIMIFSIFDQQFHPRDLTLNNQNYYEDGLKYKNFNNFVFWYMMFIAVYQSTMITLISYYALETNFIEDSGYTLQFWSTGSMIFGMVVIVSNLRVLIISSDHSIASIVSVIGSLVAYILCFLIASNIMFETATLYNELIPLFHSPNFHFGNILIIGFTSMFDLFEEWHKRWKDNAQRKKNYIEKLENELQLTEDDIVFVPNEINYDHTVQEPRFTMQSHIRKYNGDQIELQQHSNDQGYQYNDYGNYYQPTLPKQF